MKLPLPELHPHDKRWHVAILVISVAALCFFWWMLAIRTKLDIWNVDNDYATLSLAHAINIEYWVTTGSPRSVGFFQTFHPGIPFQVVSWMAFRVAALFYPENSGNLVSYTLRHPQLFWLANQVSVLLLTVVSLIGLWWLTRCLGFGFVVAAVMVFFSFQFAWLYGLLQLGNESFALPMAVAFFALGHRCLGDPRERLILWAALGALGGLALLVKLNYLIWPIAVLIGLMTELAIKGIDKPQVLLRIGSFSFGFCSVVITVAGLFLRFKGLRQMIRSHRRVISHSGYYGSGESGFVSWDSSLDALHRITGNPNFWMVSALILILVVAVVCCRLRDREWLNKNFPFAVCIICAIVFGYAAAVKHFSPHYLTCIFAVLPVGVVWLGKSVGRRVGNVIAIVIIGVVLAVGTNPFLVRSVDLARAEGTKRDLDKIYALPLGEGRLRLWSYRVNAAPYLTSFVVEMAEIAKYRSEPTIMFPQDAAYNIWIKLVLFQGAWINTTEVSWQYAIFDRRYYRAFTSLPTYFQQNGKELSGFDNVLVVSRNTPR
jgi:hypothetical protein